MDFVSGEGGLRRGAEERGEENEKEKKCSKRQKRRIKIKKEETCK